jgi:hypothetical protein
MNQLLQQGLLAVFFEIGYFKHMAALGATRTLIMIADKNPKVLLVVA